MKVLEILNNSFEYFNETEKKVINSALESLKQFTSVFQP